jgi:hypothetical protein
MDMASYKTGIKCPTCGGEIVAYDVTTDGGNDSDLEWECPGQCTYPNEVLDPLDKKVRERVDAMVENTEQF